MMRRKHITCSCSESLCLKLDMKLAGQEIFEIVRVMFFAGKKKRKCGESVR